MRCRATRPLCHGPGLRNFAPGDGPILVRKKGLDGGGLTIQSYELDLAPPLSPWTRTTAPGSPRTSPALGRTSPLTGVT
jgi:hypothetical protein